MNMKAKFTSSEHKEFHDRTLSKLLRYFNSSQKEMSRFHTRWNKSDREFRSYVPEKEEDTKRRARRDKGDPQFTTLVVPYHYAILLTAHTYWSSVFLSRTPVHQYTGRHGESIQSTQD